VVTPRSIGSRAGLQAELSRIRGQGFAVNREESEEGVASLAVPIRPARPGSGWAECSGPEEIGLPAAHYPSVAAALTKAAKEISDQLG